MKPETITDLNNRIIDILKNPSIGINMMPQGIINADYFAYTNGKPGVIIPAGCLTSDKKLISISRTEKVESFLEKLGLEPKEIKAVLVNNVELLPRSF